MSMTSSFLWHNSIPVLTQLLLLYGHKTHCENHIFETKFIVDDIYFYKLLFLQCLNDCFLKIPMESSSSKYTLCLKWGSDPPGTKCIERGNWREFCAGWDRSGCEWEWVADEYEPIVRGNRRLLTDVLPYCGVIQNYRWMFGNIKCKVENAAKFCKSPPMFVRKCKYVDEMSRLSCWPPRGQQLLHHRWI